MKRTLIVAILAFAQFSMAAAPAKVETTVSREQIRKEVVKLYDAKDPAKRELQISSMADRAAFRSGVANSSAQIKKAIVLGDQDYMVTLTEATMKSDKETLEFMAKASKGVSKVEEAAGIAKLLQVEPAVVAKFKAELLKEINENNKSLTEAVELASIAIGKKGKDLITLEKLKDCFI